MSEVEDIILIRKQVKHARIRVSEDGIIRIIIPESFTQHEIDLLIEKKHLWVERKLAYFKKMLTIKMHRSQLLLYGNRYNYFYDPLAGRNVIVDHNHKTIRTNKNLLDVPTQEKWYKSLAKKHLQARTIELATNLNLTFNKLYIRNQKKKWGNCSNEGNISLNWRLVKAPVFVIDYLIVHELVHTIIMNHTNKFWIMLKSYYPDYKEAINWLDKYGNSL